MKINEFRKLSNAVSKVVHAISICFDKAELEDVSVTYAGGYSAELNFFHGNDNIEIHIFLHVHARDAEQTIRKMYDELLSEIGKNVVKLNKIEKKEQKQWQASKVHDSSNDVLSAMSALTMFKEIITQFKGV